MEVMGIGSVAAVTIICYLLGLTIRQTPLDNKWIPSIVGGFGLILGFVGWKVIPDYPATDWLTALAVGVVSGLASTGIDQIYKQFNPSDKGRIVFPANETADNVAEEINENSEGWQDGDC